MGFVEQDIGNQHKAGQNEEWSDREMSARQEDIPNDIIVVRRDKALSSRANQTNDDGSRRYARLSSLLGQFLIPS